MTFNVAKFINHSSTLKKLVDMGVNISHWEKMKMVKDEFTILSN